MKIKSLTFAKNKYSVKEISNESLNEKKRKQFSKKKDLYNLGQNISKQRDIIKPFQSINYEL